MRIPLAIQGSAALQALTNWAGSGFPVTTEEEVKRRSETCQSCEFWKDNRCEKCGCLIQLKIRMATTKCPIGKW